ncbi:MAG: hypothetical protein AABW72_00405 [archaeon]
MPKNTGFKQIVERIKNEINLGRTELLSFRGEDIPALIEEFSLKNILVLGITGEDLYSEYLLKVNKKSNLKLILKETWDDPNFAYRKPTLSVLLPKNRNLSDISYLKFAVNKKYYRLAVEYFKKKYSLRPEILLFNGETEQAVKQGLAEACIDVVCTGKTAFNLGLYVSETIFSSDFVLIGSKGYD